MLGYPIILCTIFNISIALTCELDPTSFQFSLATLSLGLSKSLHLADTEWSAANDCAQLSPLLKPAAVSRQQSAGSPGFQPDIPIRPIADVLMTGAKDALCANCDVTRLENVWTGGVGGGPGRLAGGSGKGGVFVWYAPF